MIGDYPKHDAKMESEGLEKVCKWSVGASRDQCPVSHNFVQKNYDGKIADSIVDVIGNTPMVRINNITKKEGIECEILAKCEFMNPGGSVKDRIARRMILDAEESGRLKPGDVLVEPTSGNTGMGLAMCAAAKGYDCIITMMEKMSQEKQDCLRGLGATVVRTPTEYPMDHLYGLFGIAFTLEKELAPRAHVLNQYTNVGNPISHYNETGQEIFDQCGGKLDYCFIGAGTGGTVTGIARKLKELDKNIKIIAIDPNGSVLQPDEEINKQNPAAPGGQVIEGVGYDFIPRCFDRSVVDEWIKAEDKASFIMARRLMAEEGLFCGGSSGFAMHYAVEYIKKHNIGKDKRCVVLLPDNIRNYITKHLNADWMYERGYITEQQCSDIYKLKLIPDTDWGQKLTVGDLALPEAEFISVNATCQEAITRMLETGVD